MTSALGRQSVAFSAILVLILAACSGADAGSEAPARSGDDDDAEASLLFTQAAERARFEARTPADESEASAAQEWTLTLDGVDAHMGAFTDRPGRRAWRIPVSEFVSDWTDAFGDDPPNAVISAETGRSIAETIAVTLLDPRYDEAAAQLTYTVRAIQPEEVPDGVLSLTSGAAELPSSLGHVEIFIDTVPASSERFADTESGR